MEASKSSMLLTLPSHKRKCKTTHIKLPPSHLKEVYVYQLFKLKIASHHDSISGHEVHRVEPTFEFVEVFSDLDVLQRRQEVPRLCHGAGDHTCGVAPVHKMDITDIKVAHIAHETTYVTVARKSLSGLRSTRSSPLSPPRPCLWSLFVK